MKYYPLSNQPGDAITGRNNYYRTGTSNLDTANTDVRVDRNFGASGRGFVRYSHRFVKTAPLQAFPDDLAIAEGRVIEENRVHNFVSEYNQTIGRSTRGSGSSRRHSGCRSRSTTPSTGRCSRRLARAITCRSAATTIATTRS
jgi:hypothetical protein